MAKKIPSLFKPGPMKKSDKRELSSQLSSLGKPPKRVEVKFTNARRNNRGR